MTLRQVIAGLTVAGAALVPQPAMAQAPAMSSNVTVVNLTGETADVTVDGNPMTVPDSASAPAIRVRPGGHDVTVSTSVVRVDHVELVGSCSALWILLPTTENGVVFADEECPPERVSDDGSASVRVVNAAPNATSITLSVDGVTTDPPTRPWHASPRLTVASGRVQLDVQRADRPGVIRSASATLRGGTGYAAILAGGGERRVAFVVVEDAGRQPPSAPNPDIPINMGLAQDAPAAPNFLVIVVALGTLVLAVGLLGRRRRAVSLPLLLIVTMALIASGCGPGPADAGGADGSAIIRDAGPQPSPASSTTAPATTDAPTSVTSPPVAVSLDGGESLDVVPVSADGLGSPSVVAVGDVGWVSGTNAPGDGGMAMFVGHTTFSGRGAFAHLGDLVPGRRVQVTRSDSSSVSYVVEDRFEVAKNNFPIDAIYAPTSVPLLVLVTCSGPLSPVTRLHEFNLVVIATLASQPSS